MTNDADNEGWSNDETRIMKECLSPALRFLRHLAYLGNTFCLSLRNRGRPFAAATRRYAAVANPSDGFVKSGAGISLTSLIMPFCHLRPISRK